MALSTLPVSYCANVHPGQTLSQMQAGLEKVTALVRQRLQQPMAVGLWMTRSALTELLAERQRVGDLRRWLDDHGLCCYTMNAFPFGNFHAERVKEQVYLPDWTSPDRLQYTLDAAAALAELLPDGTTGSISTSPCAFAALHPAGADWSIYFPGLLAAAAGLADLERRTGRCIRLAIEPEPLCVLETTAQAIAFVTQLRQHVGDTPHADAVARHLGLCLDVCHQAVEFEDLRQVVHDLDAAGIPIVKTHITAALELSDPADADARRQLSSFIEPRYLHQTIGRRPGGGVVRCQDLSADLLLAPPADWRECDAWRVHFHVPIHQENIGRLRTTRREMIEALRTISRLEQTPHLEVETYTWSVLPGADKVELIDGLVQEMRSACELRDQLAKFA